MSSLPFLPELAFLITASNYSFLSTILRLGDHGNISTNLLSKIKLVFHKYVLLNTHNDKLLNYLYGHL